MLSIFCVKLRRFQKSVLQLDIWVFPRVDLKGKPCIVLAAASGGCGIPTPSSLTTLSRRLTTLRPIKCRLNSREDWVRWLRSRHRPKGRRTSWGRRAINCSAVFPPLRCERSQLRSAKLVNAMAGIARRIIVRTIDQFPIALVGLGLIVTILWVGSFAAITLKSLLSLAAFALV